MTRDRDRLFACRRRHAWLTSACTVVAGGLVATGAAAAAEGVAPGLPAQSFPPGQIFMFLFLMLGPFKIVGPFAKLTHGADAALTRRIAAAATLFASVALLLAGMLGERILSNYGIPVPVLALSGGIILFLVALQTVLQQFNAAPPQGDAAAFATVTPNLRMALSPLAFPTIVTPYGIAALVVFVAVSPDLQTRLTVGGVVLAIMAANLLVMLLTKRLISVLAVVMPILGAVLGVVQVALGLQIIHNSLRMIGVL